MTQGLPFALTDEQRRTVHAMSGYGVPHDDIATMLRIDPKTLRKHFRDELDRGSIEATAKVGQSLFRMATEGGSVAAAIFWMKARAGWREKQAVEVAFQPAKPLADYTDEELHRMIEETSYFMQREREREAAEAEEARLRCAIEHNPEAG